MERHFIIIGIFLLVTPSVVSLVPTDENYGAAGVIITLGGFLFLFGLAILFKKIKK